jgi:D-sedoheptulose 7-phosphate isomerase
MQKNIDGVFGAALDICLTALKAGKKILICGNGGSAADAQHFAAEIVGRYRKNRKAWAAQALSTDTSVITAVSNDFGFERCFARQVEALGQEGDILMAISTSGDSANIVEAAKTASRSALKVIALTGSAGGKIGPVADVLFAVPSSDTPRIQEMHGIFLHALAEIIEARLDTDSKEE